MAIVSSMAATMLPQLVMFIIDKVVKEDCCLLLVSKFESITLLDGKVRSLGLAARDTFTLFDDLCILGDSNLKRLQSLQTRIFSQNVFPRTCWKRSD